MSYRPFFWTCMTAFLFYASASGQTDPRNFRANRFEPASTSSGNLVLESGDVLKDRQWSVGLAVDYQNDPLVINSEVDGETRRLMSLLKHRVDAHVLATIGFWDIFQLGLSLPATLYQARGKKAVEEFGYAELSKGGLGDVQAALKVALLSHKKFLVDVAAKVSLTLPTATPKRAYLGERNVSAVPQLAANLPIGFVDLGAGVGLAVRDPLPNTQLRAEVGHELFAKLGVGVDLQKVIGWPLRTHVVVDGFTKLKRPFESPRATGFETLAGVSYQFDARVSTFAGAGAGLQPAYTIPDGRAFVGGYFTSSADEPVVGDSDADGIRDDRDQCPTVAEDNDDYRDDDGCADLDNDEDGVADAYDRCVSVAGVAENQGCPDVDQDQDGIVDRLDSCASEAEDKDNFADTDGCPDLDNDGDEVVDAKDRCPDVAGVAENQGCPDADRDGDTVVDRLDNCPDEAGVVQNQGCKQKQLVVIKGCKIDIAEKIYFDSGKSTILPKSYAVLDNIAQLLTNQDQINLVRVEGHTDNVGQPERNKTLSQERADSVVRYLTDKKVAASRLTAQGFGQEKPIASNKTASGRSTNRRVEFIIADCQEQRGAP